MSKGYAFQGRPEGWNQSPRAMGLFRGVSLSWHVTGQGCYHLTLPALAVRRKLLTAPKKGEDNRPQRSESLL